VVLGGDIENGGGRDKSGLIDPNLFKQMLCRYD